MISPGLLLAVAVDALLLALGHLSTGLEYYRTGQYDRALQEFAVVQRDYGETRAAEDAVYWSAKAHLAKGDKEKATAALADLIQRFPHSAYLPATAPPATPAVPVTPTPTPSPPVSAPPPPPPAAAVSSAPVESTPVSVKKTSTATVIEFDGRKFPSSVDFAKALAGLQQARTNLVVEFRREVDVDLQMVVEVIDAFNKLKISWRAP